MAFSRETAQPRNVLADVLLRGANALSPSDCALISTYVSSQRDCCFWQHAHGAVAAYRLGDENSLTKSQLLQAVTFNAIAAFDHCVAFRMRLMRP
jgi:hypothetical protein